MRFDALLSLSQLLIQHFHSHLHSYNILITSLQSTAELFAKRSLSVSLWGVVSFKAQGVGLQQLAPLAELTGGAVSEC